MDFVQLGRRQIYIIPHPAASQTWRHPASNMEGRFFVASCLSSTQLAAAPASPFSAYDSYMLLSPNTLNGSSQAELAFRGIGVPRVHEAGIEVQGIRHGIGTNAGHERRSVPGRFGEGLEREVTRFRPGGGLLWESAPCGVDLRDESLCIGRHRVKVAAFRTKCERPSPHRPRCSRF
jgi:hypothetical protein